MKLIFLDTETTGADVATDRLCQVCYKTTDGIITEYFKPPLPISVKAMSITHITNKMVEDKSSFQESQMKKDLEVLLKDGALVAHNCKFDARMLENEGLEVPHRICTYKIAQFMDPEGVIPEYNLQFLRYYLGLEIDGHAHDAEGDVRVLEAVFNRLFAKIREKEQDDNTAIQKMIEITATPTLYKKFNFGKHIGKKIEDVAKEDAGYLEWFLKQKLESVAGTGNGSGNGEDEEDWIYTLKHHLSRP